MDSLNMIKDAVSTIIDKYGVNESLKLHLELDNSPEDLFFEELSNRLFELSPEEFNPLGIKDAVFKQGE